MKINTPSAGNQSFESHRREQNHMVQSVFSEVLASAGREGYQSAEAVNEDQPLVDQIGSSWSSWFDVELGGRYQSAEDPRSMKKPFGDILARAYQEGGYTDPKAFLGRLSGEELTLVQNVHWLADPIAVESLTEEGALNLLLPPAAQVDLNHDGLTRAGAAYGMRFPNSNTPASVTRAWEDATDGMPMQDRMVYELQMMLPILTANMVIDESGAYSHHFEPGDPEFTNPMAAADYSYVKAAQDWLDHLDYLKGRIDPLRYEKDRSFWTELKQSLTEHGSP